MCSEWAVGDDAQDVKVWIQSLARSGASNTDLFSGIKRGKNMEFG